MIAAGSNGSYIIRIMVKRQELFQSTRFSLGAQLLRAQRIVPVFLPFAGCPGRCVFCAQDRQSGLPAARDETFLRQALHNARHTLFALSSEPGTTELAFYGGTFTSLPPAWREMCLNFIRRAFDAGWIRHARCSTRPDNLTPDVLASLRESGLDLVEIGVQSFSDKALRAARRAYDGQQALAGCLAVREAGLNLGIQLLPGMPQVSPRVFLNDVHRALASGPSCLRFYPCLVPEGTALATLWKNKLYAPWSLDETINTLGKGLFLAWEAGVPVIRLAVAPEPGFDASILAGPRHPAMGGMIKTRALQLTVQNALQKLGGQPSVLHLPPSCQGYMYGQRGTEKAWWAQQGLTPNRVFFDQTDGTGWGEVCVS